MSYAPSSIKSDIRLSLLRFPEDKLKIALLSLERKAEWYCAQDPREMIYLSNTLEFREFWDLFYAKPLRIKRLLYRLKFW